MLHHTNTALLIVDWQERLFPAMPEAIRERNLKQTGTLRWLAAEQGIPIIASEQYPKGLGSTLESLDIRDAVPKMHFSAMREPVFAAAVKGLAVRNIILTGMETHICVAQTCADLIIAGYDVVVPADAVLSRRKLDWDYGLSTMSALGASISTAEALLFQLLEKAGGAQFKEVSRRIR